MAKKYFDEKYLDKLKPKKTRFEIGDEGCRGIVVRVQPSGCKSLYTLFKVHGGHPGTRPRSVRTGSGSQGRSNEFCWADGALTTSRSKRPESVPIKSYRMPARGTTHASRTRSTRSSAGFSSED